MKNFIWIFLLLLICKNSVFAQNEIVRGDDYSPYDRSDRAYDEWNYINSRYGLDSKNVTGNLITFLSLPNYGLNINPEIFQEGFDYLNKTFSVISEDIMLSEKYKDSLGDSIVWYLDNGCVISLSKSHDNSKIFQILILGQTEYTEDILDTLMVVLSASGLWYRFSEIQEAYNNFGENNNICYDNFCLDISEKTNLNYDSPTFNKRFTYIGIYFPFIKGERKFDDNSLCDPNYLDACVPLSTEDLDCSDVGVFNFYVVGDDIYNFDDDGNGICCEPYPQFLKE